MSLGRNVPGNVRTWAENGNGTNQMAYRGLDSGSATADWAHSSKVFPEAGEAFTVNEVNLKGRLREEKRRRIQVPKGNTQFLTDFQGVSTVLGSVYKL